MATYPNDPDLPQGTNSTPVNPQNWNAFVDNINAIGQDLVNGRGDGQAFPGNPHSAGQCSNIADMLSAIRHMLADISGEAFWYSAPAGSLRVHNHSANQGGSIPYSSIGDGTGFCELHPQYPGAVQTNSLRGGTPSGNNAITVTTGEDVVSYVARHYYQGISSQTSLQDTYIAVRQTIPKGFAGWSATNALQVEYRTATGNPADAHVDLYVYKSGSADCIINVTDNVNTAWSNINISGSSLGSWNSGEIMEIYLKLESRSNNYARIGKIRLNYDL